MKTKKIFILFILTAILFGCNKSNNVSPAPVTQSEWAVDGKIFTGDTTYYDSSSISRQYLESHDADSNTIYIYFGTIPTVNRNYTLVNTFGGLTATDCYIISSRYNNNSKAIYQYESIGTGGTVSATIFNGKVQVTCSNVVMLNDLSGVITSFSGELIQQ
jgi:hypothetical protein